ncbi:transposase [Pontibacter sp. CAU 1760]
MDIASRIADFSRLRVFFADQGYGGQRMRDWVSNTFRHLGWKVQIFNKIHKKAFVALPKRWIRERTFGWFNLYRRLSKDYECCTKSAETMIQITMIDIIPKNLF